MNERKHLTALAAMTPRQRNAAKKELARQIAPLVEWWFQSYLRYHGWRWRKHVRRWLDGKGGTAHAAKRNAFLVLCALCRIRSFAPLSGLENAATAAWVISAVAAGMRYRKPNTAVAEKVIEIATKSHQERHPDFIVHLDWQKVYTAAEKAKP